MPSFSGKSQYLDETGAISQSGPCRVTIEGANLRLIPEKGQPLALDLGDIQVFAPGGYNLSLELYTGKTIRLEHFGKAFQNLCHDLLEAYRDRLVQCLLLEDLEEIERFDGFAQFSSNDQRSFSSPAELRLYKSNIAVLPERATGLQWRLADIDSMEFDEATYRLEIASGKERLVLTKLAKRTGEFMNRLRTAMDDISDKSAKILQSLFPFLAPDQFQEVAGVMKEGRPVSLAWMNSVHAKLGSVLVEKTVDNSLKPYFDILKGELGADDFFAGFKFIRPEAEETLPAGVDGQGAPPTVEPTENGAETLSEAETETEIGQEDPVLHWFMLPLRPKTESGTASNVVAWESTSRSGRATYFFRLLPEDRIEDLKDAAKARAVIQSAVERINRALVLLNFRREPIYLPDSSLETEERYRRYAIACINLPILRQLRASFLGRALHTSPDNWQKQVETILAKA
jgi:hypothetical protein